MLVEVERRDQMECRASASSHLETGRFADLMASCKAFQIVPLE